MSLLFVLVAPAVAYADVCFYLAGLLGVLAVVLPRPADGGDR